MLSNIRLTKSRMFEEFQLVAAFDQERQQRDGDDDVECKEELEDPHEAELLRVAEVFRHGLRLQSRATDLSWWRASPMALRAQFVQYISADRRKARSERQMPRSLRRTRRSCRYQRLSVGSRAPMNETASSRVMWHDSAMNGRSARSAPRASRLPETRRSHSTTSSSRPTESRPPRCHDPSPGRTACRSFGSRRRRASPKAGRRAHRRWRR